MRDTYTPQDINPPADGCEPDRDELDLAESFIQAREYTDDLHGSEDNRQQEEF
jgi:hypothetical protein